MTLYKLLIRHKQLPKELQAVRVVIRSMDNAITGSSDPVFTGGLDSLLLDEFIKKYGKNPVDFMSPPRENTLNIWIRGAA